MEDTFIGPVVAAQEIVQLTSSYSQWCSNSLFTLQWSVMCSYLDLHVHVADFFFSLTSSLRSRESQEPLLSS